MLQFQIKDYNNFKEIFGTRNSARGCIYNKILLSFWKYRYKIDGDARASHIQNLQDLYKLVLRQLNYHRSEETFTYIQYSREGKELITIRRSPTMYLKTRIGTYCFFAGPYANIPGDRTGWKDNNTQVTYLNQSNNHIESMSAGKFIRKVMEFNRVQLDEATIGYVSEEFQREWESTYNIYDSVTLHVDDNFEDIYTSSNHSANFGSCMNDKRQWTFYRDQVNAKAAYLINNVGQIAARCIVYQNVRCGDKVYNYAERAYGESEVYCRCLIKKLIEGGYIQIHKALGAGCRDVTAVVDIQGNRIDKPLIIDMDLTPGCTLSFLDTFIYYYPNHKVASNNQIYKESDYNLGHVTRIYNGR